MRKSIIIARITFLEAVRDRFFNFMFVLSFALLASGSFFLKFDFGSTDIDFLIAFSVGTISFFGILISILLTVHLWFSEIQNRTMITMLARPVTRYEYLAGKVMGVAGILFSFTLFMGCLAYISIALWNQTRGGYDIELMLYIILPFSAQLLAVFMKLMVLASIVFLICVIGSSSLFAMLISFVLLIASMFQFVARDAYLEFPLFPVGWFCGLVSIIIPGFQVLDYNFMKNFSQENWAQLFLFFLGYCSLYIVGYTAAAYLLFEKKNILQSG